mgnify:CR=1 FL=1
MKGGDDASEAQWFNLNELPSLAFDHTQILEKAKEALKQNNMTEAVTCRPADLIENEWDKMVKEAKENGGNGSDEDTLTYAMFPKVAPKFFAERAKGPISSDSFAVPKSTGNANGGSYTVTVNGTAYNVTTSPSGDKMNVNVNGTNYDIGFAAPSAAPAAAPKTGANALRPSPEGAYIRFVAENLMQFAQPKRQTGI